MYKHYYINNNQTSNPGIHHEIHTKEHAAQLGIRSTQYVDYYANEVEAVVKKRRKSIPMRTVVQSAVPMHIGGDFMDCSFIMSFTIPMAAGM